MNKKLITLPLLALFAVGVITARASTTSAHGFGMADSTLVSSLAEKLGVSEDRVDEAFTQIHSERMAEHEAQLDERLNQAVTDGTITDAQLRAIKEKHQEMKENRTELEAWASENGLSLEVLHELLGHGKMFHMKHRAL